MLKKLTLGRSYVFLFWSDAIIISSNCDQTNYLGATYGLRIPNCRELAEYLRLPLSTVYKLVQDKRLSFKYKNRTLALAHLLCAHPAGRVRPTIERIGYSVVR